METMKKAAVVFEEQAPMISMPPPKKEKTMPPQTDEAPYIELVTGGLFFYNKPTWDIGAIAHSLSMVCRFGGQCKKFYSVAEHSILVSRIMEDHGLGDPMEGLLHDATESVLTDLPRPAKRLLKDYKTLENALDSSMRKTFVLPEKATEGCHRADQIALLIESKELMSSRGRADYGQTAELQAFADRQTYMVVGYTPENARERFMTRMHDIRRRTRGLR
jgi:uncharacterized protein